MARTRFITASKILRMQKQGRGLGHGASYKPWITIRDVPSIGFSHRIKGWKTNRTHHLLSKVECSFFYLLENAPTVVDIREKYPLLPITETLSIAKRLGIRHACITKTLEPIVMVTDFLVEEQVNGEVKFVAYSVVPENKAHSKHFKNRSLIEQLYWKSKGINFVIVTTAQIPKTLARNIEWIHSCWDLKFSPGIDVALLSQMEAVLYETLQATSIHLNGACLQVDNELGLRRGTSIWAVKHLIATKAWIVDLSLELDVEKPLLVTRSSICRRTIKHHEGE